MIKQIINGQTRNIVSVKASTADMATLSAILAGKLETWDVVSEGGTTANPAQLNFVRFAVGKKGINSRNSASVTIPHIKFTKTYSDISSAVIGVWDQDYLSAIKCEYCTLVGASSLGA